MFNRGKTWKEDYKEDKDEDMLIIEGKASYAKKRKPVMKYDKRC